MLQVRGHLHVVSATPASGKSVITTALIRALRDDGVRVLPFKPVSEAPGDGGPPGPPAALVHQCFAAGVPVDTRMAPVRVVAAGGECDVWLGGRLLGRVPRLGRDMPVLGALGDASARLLRGHVEAAAAALRRDCDALVSEGAGALGELTALSQDDIANVHVARLADGVALVARTSQGGTFQLIDALARMLLADPAVNPLGFVVNDVRACRDRYERAAAAAAARLGLPCLGLVPWSGFFAGRPKYEPPSEGCREDHAHLARLVREGLDLRLHPGEAGRGGR
jgi:adenosylcobyric acid synthase